MAQYANSLAKRQASCAAQVANSTLTAMLDSSGYKKRFDELLGRRAPQFISSLVSLINADGALMQAWAEAPQTVIQAALRAASYDLPIDPGLGFAYIFGFNNKKRTDDGRDYYRHEAAFVIGYKGMKQLAMRTGCYARLNVTDVREGELRHYNRLTEDLDIAFIEDEEEREKLPIIGWAGYFRLVNGMEKTIYMSRAQIEAHEKRNRKGKYMGKGWRDYFDAMAEKTVYRRLIGKNGLMSIDYQRATDPAALAAAQAIASGQFDDEDRVQSSVEAEAAESPEPAQEIPTDSAAGPLPEEVPPPVEDDFFAGMEN